MLINNIKEKYYETLITNLKKQQYVKIAEKNFIRNILRMEFTVLINVNANICHNKNTWIILKIKTSTTEKHQCFWIKKYILKEQNNKMQYMWM